MNNLNDYSIPNLLPESLKEPFIIAFAEAIEIELKQAYREAEVISNFSEVENLPENLLDYLAYQKHVDFYEFDLPIEQKRKLIKNSSEWHRKKGTPWAVEQVSSIIFEKAIIKEWFEYNGDPFRFLIQLDLDADYIKHDKSRLRELIDATKNKRSKLEKIVFKGSILFSHLMNVFTKDRVQILTKSNPWAFAGIGQGDGAERVYLDGEYLLNGERALNSFVKSNGPAYDPHIRLSINVNHDFGVYEVNSLPSLDGEFNLDGEILLQNVEQLVKLAVLQDTKVRYKKREVINLKPKQETPILSKIVAMNGVTTLNGQGQLNGLIKLEQALLENKACFRVKSGGVIVEEVAI